MTRNGQLLRTIRGVTGISRAELARRCGLSVETLKKIESGRGDGSLGTWEAIKTSVAEWDYVLAEHFQGKTKRGIIDCDDCQFSSTNDLSMNVYRSSNGLLLCIPQYLDTDCYGIPWCGYIKLGNVTAYQNVLKRQLEVLGS